jgi:hypothetical protein
MEASNLVFMIANDSSLHIVASIFEVEKARILIVCRKETWGNDHWPKANKESTIHNTNVIFNLKDASQDSEYRLSSNFSHTL